MSKLPDPIDNPRRWAREMRVAVHNNRSYRQAQVLSSLERLLKAKATCREYHQVGLFGHYCIPGGRKRILAWLAQHVGPASGLHHLR
jgi:hypothetical protein